MRCAAALTLPVLSSASSAVSRFKSNDFICCNHEFQTMHCTHMTPAPTLRAMTAEHPTDAISPPLRLSFAMLMLMLMLAALDQTIVSTALPSIARDLQGASRMSWVFSAYLIASTVAVPLYGRLADLHGSKPMLLAALAMFLFGSALCGISRDMTVHS